MIQGPGALLVELAGPLVLLALLIGVGVSLRRRRTPSPVTDGSPDEPYRVYTRSFDQELHARNVLAVLPKASRDRQRGWQIRSEREWRPWIGRVEALLEHQREAVAACLPAWRRAAEGMEASDFATAILIDQSGSMKGEPMAAAAATADLISAQLAAFGVRSEVLGFSTAGWHGGKAYEQWQRDRRPERPGRLCALMHVVYKSADEPNLSQSARDIMVHPDLLRENVDGEAILWAKQRLASLPEPHKLLLILSDGAPVDDVTLMHNGPSYLWRHLNTRLADLRGDPALTLGAVGISYRVDSLYPVSEHVRSASELPAAAARVMGKMLAEARRKASA